MQTLLVNPHMRVLARSIIVSVLGVVVSGGDPRMLLVAAAQALIEYLTPVNQTVGLSKAQDS